MVQAYEGNIEILPGEFVADVDLSAHQYMGVKVTATGMNKAGDGEDGFILQNKPELGYQVEAGFKGVSIAKSGAAFAIDTDLAFDANGKLITAASGKEIVAHSLKAASGADELVAVLVGRKGIKA
jgi:hypothetical protein